MTTTISKMELTYELTQSQLDAIKKKEYYRGYHVGKKNAFKDWQSTWKEAMKIKNEQTGLEK
jgi:hypothetical protein